MVGLGDTLEAYDDAEVWLSRQALEPDGGAASPALALTSCGTSGKCCHPLNSSLLTHPRAGNRVTLMGRL